MENNNIEIENQTENMTKSHKKLYLIIGIIVLLIAVLGGTYAFYAFSTSNSNITSTAGDVNLNLTVTKALPLTSGTDDILITNFSEIAKSLNAGCIDSDGEFALCQLYRVNLVNNSNGVNTPVTGSISFNNETAPNLSWILIDNYDASTSYTADTLASTFNTASSTYTNFVEDYLLNNGENVDFYILVWVNEAEDIQTDEGSYSGTIKFEDANGQGITSTFTS